MKVSRLMVVAALLCGLVWLCGGIAQAFECKGAIGDYVWIDADRDGIQDTSEDGLAGVVVHLFEYNWNTSSWFEVLPAKVTDADGYYVFTDLADSDFYLKFDLPTGYTWTLQDQGSNDAVDSDVNPATGKTVQFDILCDEIDLTWDAGVLPPCEGTIGDYVWVDANRNGIQDDGAGAGLGGVTVTLYKADGTVVNSDITDASGYYLFEKVADGSYYLVFTLPSGYVWTLEDQGTDNAADSDVDSDGATEVFSLPCGGNDLTWDAGLLLPCKGSIGDYVWVDANRNGIQDEGADAGVGGVNVTLFTAGGTQVGVTTTDANGYYLFMDVEDGDYYLVFQLPTGYTWTAGDQGTDNALDSDVNDEGTTATFALPCSGNDLTWDAGLLLPCKGSIGDYVWKDANKNGLQDDGTSAGVGGVNVTLYAADGSPVGVTTTDANGYYLFLDVPQGDYYLIFQLPSGYAWTTKDAGDNALDSDVDATGKTATFTLPCSANDLTWDAGVITKDESIIVKKTGAEYCGCWPLRVGDKVRFEITVTANLLAPRAVEIRDYIDSCLSPTYVSNGGSYIAADRCVVWPVTLPAGSSVTTVSFIATITKLPVGDNGSTVPPGGFISDPVLLNVESSYSYWGYSTGSVGVMCTTTNKTLKNYATVVPPTDKITICKSGAELGGACHTIGFWKNNISKAMSCRTNGTQVTKAELVAWLKLVREFYLDNPYKNLLSTTSDYYLLKSAYNVLSYSGCDIVKKTLRQLLACELNYVSVKFSMEDRDAHAALLKQTEDALQNPSSALYALHDQLDWVNNLGNTTGDGLKVGDTVLFKITVTANLVSAKTFEVRDYVDSCLGVSAVSNGGTYTSADRCVKWTLSLPQGQSTTTLTFQAKINSLPAGNNGGSVPTGALVSNTVILSVGSGSRYGSSVDVMCGSYTPPCSYKLKNYAWIIAK